MATGAWGGGFCTDSEPLAIGAEVAWCRRFRRHCGYHAGMIGTRARKMRPWPLAVLLLFALGAQAAEVSGVHVARDGARFLIDMHIAIDAPAPAVFRALQNYAAMARYNPDLRAVRVERTGTPDRVRLFTTIHTCVLIFCKTMHQEQIMTAVADADGGALYAELLPYGGDFKGGRGLWVVKPCRTVHGETCMDVRIVLVPAFWVPPVLGPWVMGRKMDAEARLTAAGLERTAQGFARRAAR